MSICSFFLFSLLSMNLIIDNGNSFLKIGLFEQGQFVLSAKYQAQEYEKMLAELKGYSIEASILSSVAELPQSIDNYISNLPFCLKLNSETPIPIGNNYQTPLTLGYDRLANAVGAWEMFKKESVLIIDAGTCLKYDFVDKYGVYQGGAISPGLLMRYQSLHHFTDRLPLLLPVGEADLIGSSTTGSIHSGVINGMLGEIKFIINDYQMNIKPLRVIITGGDAPYFLNKLKTFIFAAPTLTLQGLDSILRYNQ